MKKIINIAFIVQCSIVLLISCDLKTKKESEMIEKERQEEQVKLAEQERQEEKRRMERFAGKYYTWENGGIEVLSDGRVISFDDWDSKEYLGNIQIVSDNAFLVEGHVPHTGNTSIYRIDNGVENDIGSLGRSHNTGFIFDISEKRVYFGQHYLDAMKAYKNKDIANPKYIKYY